MQDKVSGLIDFYFACNDMYAYDLAVMLNSWCFESDGAYNVTKGKALIAAYRAGAAPDAKRKNAALPVLMRGAALRFLLTRLYDWLNPDPNALVRPKDPARIFQAAALSPEGEASRRVWACERVELSSSPMAPVPEIPVRAAGPRSCEAARMKSELSGGEAQTTNNRMELMAVIEGLRRSSAARTSPSIPTPAM